MPPFCPRVNCKNHFPALARPVFFRRHGVKEIKRFPYFTIRFQCKDCDISFSASFFQLHYRNKVWGLDEFIFRENRLGISMRETARYIGHSERLVRTRVRKMARWSLLFHLSLTENLPIHEPVVYDGLENFAFSQYDPNHIQHAVGKRSLFTYDFNFVPLNRKGRMTPRQVSRKAELEVTHGGAYPRNAIRTGSAKIFRRLLEKTENTLTLYTDEHFQYRRAITWDLGEARIEHIRISSKAARNFKNDLFAVNNIDMQARQNLAPFRRETIVFSKHEIAMQDSFMLYIVHRNYMRPKFWGTHRSDENSATKSPAMQIGLMEKILHFKDLFKQRILPSQVKLHEDSHNLYHRIAPHSRRTIALAPAI